MQKQLNFWIWFGNVILSLLIWPFAPLWISKIGILDLLPGRLIMALAFLYFALGGYLTSRFYQYRMKNYVFPKKNKPCSVLKGIGIFLLIWPGISILLVFADEWIGPLFETTFFFVLRLYYGVFGWMLAASVVCWHRNCSLPDQPEKPKKPSGIVIRIIRWIIGLSILGLVGMVVFNILFGIDSMENIGFDDGHRDFGPSGATIRLAISEEECQQYPNRYYFKNLCILCPDEQPMVDGHCQRCPGNDFVISNGCRSCEDDNNYITPKVECDACPNRVYEGGLCKLKYKTRMKSCWERYPWKGTKEECDACEYRRYTEEGLCELYYHGWVNGDPQQSFGGVRADSYYENNKHLGTRYIDRNNHIIREEYYEYEGYDDADHTWTRRHTNKYLTYFKNGQLRTKKTSDSMEGYYENGVLAFEQDDEIVKFYDRQGYKIGFGSLVKKHRAYEILEIYVWMGDDYYPLDDAALLDYFKENYPIEFELPFSFKVPEGNPYPIRYLRYNEEAERKFEKNTRF